MCPVVCFSDYRRQRFWPLLSTLCDMLRCRAEELKIIGIHNSEGGRIVVGFSLNGRKREYITLAMDSRHELRQLL